MILLKTIIFSFIIYCESKSEPFIGKIAVGETLEYRYSKNLSSIFGKNQFSFNVGKMYIDNIKEIPECILSAFLTSNGLLLTGKKKYYFNSNNKIPKNSKFIMKIGKHSFFEELT